MSRARIVLLWLILSIVVAVPVAASALSPLLQWRDPIYIGAGFAGVFALALLLFQPLLAAGYLPGISRLKARRVHRWVGTALVVLVLLHVAGLWLTSPPDVIDALLFVSPTPFSNWGVIAMWAVFLAAGLTALRARLRIRPEVWRLSHKILVIVIVTGSVVHAMKIEGTMEVLSKSVLCLLLLVVTTMVLVRLRWRK